MPLIGISSGYLLIELGHELYGGRYEICELYMTAGCGPGVEACETRNAELWGPLRSYITQNSWNAKIRVSICRLGSCRRHTSHFGYHALYPRFFISHPLLLLPVLHWISWFNLMAYTDTLFNINIKHFKTEIMQTFKPRNSGYNPGPGKIFSLESIIGKPTIGKGPPRWSSGQHVWLLIMRSRVHPASWGQLGSYLIEK